MSEGAAPPPDDTDTDQVVTPQNEHQMVVRLTATPFNDLVSPELFQCHLCCAIVTNPQQHFRWHESTLVTKEGAELFLPFLVKAGPED